jgi:putative membrane protein insertion efficiency factor
VQGQMRKTWYSPVWWMQGLIRLYRWFGSPLFGGRCRYLPTCSEYAYEAIGEYGAWRGGWLAVKRVGRCHPFGGAGYDPVPERPE